MRVYDERGRPLGLRAPGRSGGEGTVHAVEGRPLHVAKIYHPGKVDAELERKVRAMAANPPEDPAYSSSRHRSIAWVWSLLYHDAAATRFAGFLMPAIDTRAFREAHLYYDTSDRLARFGGAFTWRHLLTAASNLASAVAAVHAQGHRVGDLRETNLLVSPTALISLIDCDSFQIADAATGRTFPTRVGTGEYLPPELHGADFRADHDRTYSDRFALGVLLFKFLMLGTHPFQSTGRRVEDAPSIEAKVARGLYPYPRRRGVDPPRFAPPYDVLPPSVRALFERCFVEGHRRPRRRPGAEEWFRVLKAEAGRARQCGVIETHWFGGHRRTCPWCALATDPFPSGAAVGAQQPVAAASPRVVAPRPASTPTSAPARRFRVRLTRRRVIVVLAAAGLLVAASSPLGHTTEAPQRTVTKWSAKASGPCPYDPGETTEPPTGCDATWRFGPVERIEHRARRLFLLRRDRTEVRVSFVVRFDAGDRTCEIPWMDSKSFNDRARRVCLGACDDRIALIAGVRSLRLIARSGVAARTTTLGCGTYRGTWTFDAGDSDEPFRLSYPGLPPLRLPAVHDTSA